MDINNIEITQEMMEAVALAELYREDSIMALRKVITDKKITSKEMANLLKTIHQHPDYKKVQADVVELEEVSLVDDDMNTIMLFYNKLLRDAQQEKKYEVAARILGEIRKLKAIENEQTKFEVIITVEKPEDK